MTMKKAELALVTISAEYLCDHNNLHGNTANNKVLYYEVELVDFIKVSFSYLSKHTIVQGIINEFKTST